VKKILIVADLQTLIEKEKGILNRSDFKFFTATSSVEALNIHKVEKVDLIITNLDMPVISGDKLCSIIRKDEKLKKVSIIIVCGRSNSDIDRCTKCNANSYITRPVKPSLLLEKVSQLLDIPVRQSYRVLLKVKVDGKYKNEPFFCYSRNISRSGILLETERVLSKGDPIYCSFFLPDSKNITASGEVVRVSKSGTGTYMYGVKFSNLDPTSGSDIEAFIRNRSDK